MKVLILYDNSGPKYHRLLLPMSLMPGIELVISGVLTDEICEGVDVLFFNRVIGGQSVQSVLDLKAKHGFKMVVDFDDHWILGADHYLYETYRQARASEIMEAYIKESDAVTVTHDRLADLVRPINPNVSILPNSIPYFGQFTAKKINDDDNLTRLFWAGGVTHKDDIQLLFEPIKKIRTLPVKTVLGGYIKNNEYHKMRNSFTRYGKMPHELIEKLPVESYYYAYSKCDISLVPLIDTKFNSLKSNLKILEAANIWANVIVSNVHPYKDVPFVNYVNEGDDWFRHVKWLLDNPEEAKEQAANLQVYCRENFNFESINKKRYELLCSLKTVPA